MSGEETNHGEFARHDEAPLIVEFTEHLIDAVKHLLVIRPLHHNNIQQLQPLSSTGLKYSRQINIWPNLHPQI